MAALPRDAGNDNFLLKLRHLLEKCCNRLLTHIENRLETIIENAAHSLAKGQFKIIKSLP